MPPRDYLGQTPGLVAHDMGHPGDGPGAAASDAYVPTMIDQEYTPREGLDSFPEPGWVVGTQAAGAFHEPPGSFTDPFNNNNRWVQPISQEHAYANPGPQVN